MSPYLRRLRAKIGNDLLLLPSVAAVIQDEAGRSCFRRKLPGRGGVYLREPLNLVRLRSRQSAARFVKRPAFLWNHGKSLACMVGANFVIFIQTDTKSNTWRSSDFCVPVGKSLEPLDPETRSLRYFREDEMPRLALPYPTSALFPAKRPDHPFSDAR